MKTNTKIVPALLTDNREDLISMVTLAKSFTNWVQIDFMDGCFVPSRSITPEDVASIKPEIGWEAHLMVQEPENILYRLKQAGAGRVIFHFEATSNHERTVHSARALDLEVGIALNPLTPAESINTLVDKMDCVLFMTVNPGFYGAQFIPEVLGKIKTFRRQHSEIEIGVDGGAKEENIRTISAAGVSSICVGSAIFLSENPAASYCHLSKIANS